MISILLVSTILADFFYGTTFLIFYIPLRIRAGGYHATSYGKCYLISVMSFILLLLSHLYFGKKNFFDEILWLCAIFAIVYIYNTAPIINKNNLISINIARIILKKPEIYLLDEPTSALDLDNKEDILKVINRLSKNNMVIMITHDIETLNFFNSPHIVQIDNLNKRFS